MLPEDHPVTWLRRGDGLVGWGVAAEIRTRARTGSRTPTRGGAGSPRAAVVRNDVDEPGSGLVAFGTFAFADEPGRLASLVVPEVILGRRGEPPG